MWIFTPFGFFSIVKKHSPSTSSGQALLTVRARVAADLDSLRTRVPELGETQATPDQDYPFRATVSAVDLAIGLGEAIQAIDYDNFKAEVSRQQGWWRAGMYGEVWALLRAALRPLRSVVPGVAGLRNLSYDPGPNDVQ